MKWAQSKVQLVLSRKTESEGLNDEVIDDWGNSDTWKSPRKENMAANFWTSSHYKQLLDQEDVDVVSPLDREKGITLEDFKLIKMQMANYISKLAQHVKVRQRVVATAVTYMRRVYTKKSMSEYDPRLVAPTCLYLASKAEESTVQAKLLVFYIKKFYTDDKYRYEIKDILEMEMKILEALNYYLVVYHPYRSLSQLLQDAGLSDISMTQLTWGVVNDTYKMDLALVHPPHLIALACIYIASVLRDKDTTAWFEELRVDMNVVKNISMEILDFYENHQTILDERFNSALNKLPYKS
ncbi:cyclin-C1-2 [Pyrus x bretschneideri]|uniref:cyclin-C1-2 n=1 Tax=Pyrus x bretschneideri TaxID=225117 RepID=UPI00202E47A9|nr:cyclin-C1-2 [Pyrus x bretschneideri]